MPFFCEHQYQDKLYLPHFNGPNSCLRSCGNEWLFFKRTIVIKLNRGLVGCGWKLLLYTQISRRSYSPRIEINFRKERGYIHQIFQPNNVLIRVSSNIGFSFFVRTKLRSRRFFTLYPSFLLSWKFVYPNKEVQSLNGRRDERVFFLWWRFSAPFVSWKLNPSNIRKQILPVVFVGESLWADFVPYFRSN